MKTPISLRAVQTLKHAIATGQVIKPSTCEQCGKAPKNLHGHHEDYNKPLVVIWLCPKCHRIEHGRLHAAMPRTGKRFRKERLKLFATQQEAATAMGITVGALSHWEVDRRPIPEIAWILLGYIEREQEAA